MTVQVVGIDRVLVATPDVDGAAEQFSDRLGLSFGERIDPPDEPVENRMSPAGVEFVSSDDPDSPVGRFLERRGPGLYALALEVADLDAARSALAEKSVDPIGETEMGRFRELFYHPSEFAGALLVLTAYDARHPAEVAALRGDESDDNPPNAGNGRDDEGAVTEGDGEGNR